VALEPEAQEHETRDRRDDVAETEHGDLECDARRWDRELEQADRSG